MKNLILTLTLIHLSSYLIYSEERMLLAAFNQLIEIDRSGQIHKIYETEGHVGIYDAWKCPDGSIFYPHKKGVAWMDESGEIFMEHAAQKTPHGLEINGCCPYENGDSFAFIDSGVPEIRVINRKGDVLSKTPLPLYGKNAHVRYRTLRKVQDEKAFWVCQLTTQTLLKVEEATGNIVDKKDISKLLPRTKSKKLFGVTSINPEGYICTTGPGKQLVHLDQHLNVKYAKNQQDLQLNCRYFLGTQKLDNGHLLMACGDYHMKSEAEVSDLLVELDENFKVVWKLERQQIIDQICGYHEKKTGFEEIRITNVHLYNPKNLIYSLNSLK